MRNLLLVSTVALLAAGCSTTNQITTEIQEDYDASGKLVKRTEITTETEVTTRLQSQQKAKSISSSNSPEAQSVEITDINQEADLTGVIEAIGKVAGDVAGKVAKETIESLSPVGVLE